MEYRTLTITLNPPVAEIRLGGGPIDACLLEELDAAALRISDDATMRCVLLTTDPGGFSRATADDAYAHALPFRCLELMAQPVIAVIEGDATGGGLELALACDMRVADEQARFAMPLAANGAVAPLGGTQRLPRLVGRARASELVLLGESIDAATALSYGLVNAVAEHGQARARAEAIAASICARGPLAVRYAKEAVLHGLDMPLDQALRYETDLTIILQTTEDRAEGVRAFLQKREPRFEGR